jgi:hypothetical protein
MFYELDTSLNTSRDNEDIKFFTKDHLVATPEAHVAAKKQWDETKTGVLADFPFGAFAFARLDEQLGSSALWKDARARCLHGRDPMGLSKKQPHVEFFTSELYGGPSQFSDKPAPGQSAFSIIPELFGQQSRGTVTLRNEAPKDPFTSLVIDHNYLDNPLDLLVLAEACSLASKIVMKGNGIKKIVKGSWPPSEEHHKLETRQDWVPFVKKHATTCEYFVSSS